MTNDEIYKIVAKKLGISPKLVKRIYLSYWSFIRAKIQELPLKTINEDEFDSLKVNFSVPFIGKLYLTKQRFLNIRKKYEYDKRKISKAAIQRSDNDG